MKSPEMAPAHGIEHRIAEFRNDPQKMEITTRFVNEVIAEAKMEAMNRAKRSEKSKLLDSAVGNARKRGAWHSRARGFFTRLFSSFCFCNSEVKV